MCAKFVSVAIALTRSCTYKKITLGQTMSLYQRSCCFGVTLQIDLGLHSEIVQNCFHVQSVCTSCSERVELAFNAALSVRVLQPAQSASVNTSIVATSSVFRGLSCTVRNSHSSLFPRGLACPALTVPTSLIMNCSFPTPARYFE